MYGLGRHHPELIVIFRDGLRLLFCLFLAVRYRHLLRKYFRNTRGLWIVFLLLLARSIGLSIFADKLNSDIIIGAKYGMQFVAVFLTAIFVGHIFAEQGKEKTATFFKYVFFLLAAVIVF